MPTSTPQHLRSEAHSLRELARKISLIEDARRVIEMAEDKEAQAAALEAHQRGGDGKAGD